LHITAGYIPKPKGENKQKVMLSKPTWQQVCREKFGFDPEKCPCCGTGIMKIIGIVDPRPPPVAVLHAWTQHSEYIGVMEPLVSEQTEPVKLADKVIAKL